MVFPGGPKGIFTRRYAKIIFSRADVPTAREDILSRAVDLKGRHVIIYYHEKHRICAEEDEAKHEEHE